MKLGLGIGVPYGSGVLNPDKLSLDLQFATDKTLTARKGPTPAFTRATGATQVNAAGLIEYAPENLILYSNNVANASWSVGGGTIASSAETVNGLTAEIYNEDSTNSIHRFFRVNTGLAGITSTFSVWLKAAGRRYVCVNFGSSGPNSNSKLVLDLVDRVVIAGTAGVTTSILLENNGWARYSFTFVPRVDSGTMPIQSNFSSTVVSETGVGLNGAAFYVAGQQYERFSTARPYLLTTANPSHAPRFDHDPVTLACKGLLIEEGKTNLCLRSDDFNVSPWTKNAAMTVTANAQVAPDGTTTADTINNSASGANFLLQTVSVTAGASYVFSFYAKKGSASSLIARIRNETASTIFLVLDYSSLVSTSSWTRISIPFTAPAGCTSVALRIRNDDGVGDVHLWGAQLEAGLFPTSYIPTAAATVPRSADVCSITGANFTSFYNQSEWTLYADLSGLMSEPLGGQRPFVAISDGTYSNFFSILKASGTGSFQAEALTSSALQFRLGNAYAPYTRYKIALGAKTDNANASYNGVLKTTDTTVTMPSTMNRLEFRDPTGAAAGHPSCHIAAIRYYKKRLPNAKLQSLTS